MSWRGFLWAVLACFAIGLAARFAFASAGYRLNTTESLPVGLYALDSGTLKRGQLVIVCPPDAPIFREAKQRGYIGPGECPAGTEEVGKTIAGLPGDRVTETDAGVWINGQAITNSLPFVRDPEGRALPRIRLLDYVLPPGQVWLMGMHQPLSFDSRYFGAVDVAAIKHYIRPVLTYGK